MANLEPFEDKLDKMINEEEYRPCMFSGECAGFVCDKYLRDCQWRGNKK